MPMTDPDRKTITIDGDLHRDLKDAKRGGESWSDLLRRLADSEAGRGKADRGSETLTESHIEDIASLTARRTVEELETLRR